MSDTILHIIPTNPSAVPDKDSQEKAKSLLATFYRDDQIEFDATDTVEFISQGENFDDVSCNLCGKLIPTEDWQNEMENAFGKQFQDLEFITRCCHKKTSLNDLTYRGPAGFAKFVMSISGPENELQENVIVKLQEILGTSLRIIWAHY